MLTAKSRMERNRSGTRSLATSDYRLKGFAQPSDLLIRSTLANVSQFSRCLLRRGINRADVNRFIRFTHAQIGDNDFDLPSGGSKAAGLSGHTRAIRFCAAASLMPSVSPTSRKLLPAKKRNSTAF